MLARVLLAVSLALALAACGGADEESEPAATPPPQTAALTDVDGVLAVRAAFNADSGRPRLLLLLSPT